MIEIPLAAIPNQSLSIRLGDSQYDIRIHACSNIVVVDIERDNVAIVTGSRAVAGYPIIPYDYLEDGNFVIVTANDEYPDYTQFGISQFLIYATQAEISSLRAGT